MNVKFHKAVGEIGIISIIIILVLCFFFVFFFYVPEAVN